MLPKTGKSFPRTSSIDRDYASLIAKALRTELGDTHQAIKTLRRWTGASERTVKNWLAGTNGPTAPHLMILLNNSDTVLSTVLSMAGRERLIVTHDLIAVRVQLSELIDLIDKTSQLES